VAADANGCLFSLDSLCRDAWLGNAAAYLHPLACLPRLRLLKLQLVDSTAGQLEDAVQALKGLMMDGHHRHGLQVECCTSSRSPIDILQGKRIASELEQLIYVMGVPACICVQDGFWYDSIS
jgi:hypothetical protein